MKFLRSLFGKSADQPVTPEPKAETAADPVMTALAELEVKRLREALAAVTPAAPALSAAEPSARPNRVVRSKPLAEEAAPAASVNIWDLDDDVPAAAAPAPAAPERRRPTRSKTRILGFDPQAASVVPLFDEAEPPVTAAVPAAPSHGHVMFPAGWLVVRSGPGKGATYALSQGVSQIGRGSDQTVALDFGDMAISRHNHAAIAYDPATHRFHIGHGGKSNLVRLNGKPLLSTEALSDGDEIQIGETTLMLKVLCTPEFNWSSGEAGGDGHDMAIA